MDKNNKNRTDISNLGKLFTVLQLRKKQILMEYCGVIKRKKTKDSH